ncbi:MAG: YncE family protein [Thiotrichaceae bacterium]
MKANRQLKLASCDAFAGRLIAEFAKLIVLSSICFGTLAQADIVYVANTGSDNVSVIDTSNNSVSATIPGGVAPNGLAINPLGTRAYVTNNGSGNLSVLDVSNNNIVATVPVGQYPWGVAINPSGTRGYVANQGSNNISVIDLSINSVVATVSVGNAPTAIAVNPLGTRVYVTNHNSNSISVIDTNNNSVIATVSVGTTPIGVALNPSGTRVYVANYASNNISVIDTSNNSVVATMIAGKSPWGIAINPTGTRAYVTNDGSNNLSVIDTGTNNVVATIATGNFPRGVAINSTGTRVYVNNYSSNTVSIIDASTNSLITTVAVGSNPLLGIAIRSTNICPGDTNGSTQAGIDQCKANPASCGITTGTPAAIIKIDGISTNAFVTPANKMIAGVLISGGTKRVMVRASSVDGAVDPLVEIFTYPDRKLLGNNDSWATDPAATELTQKKLAPARATDAATILSLPPGLFTMEITSKNGGSGANVIEVYDMLVFP